MDHLCGQSIRLTLPTVQAWKEGLSLKCEGFLPENWVKFMEESIVCLAVRYGQRLSVRLLAPSSSSSITPHRPIHSCCARLWIELRI